MKMFFNVVIGILIIAQYVKRKKEKRNTVVVIEQNENKKKSIEFWWFLCISLLVWIYLFIFVGSIFNNYEGYSNEAEFPTAEVGKKIIKFIWPAVYFYIVCAIFFIIKKVKPRKTIYTVITITFFLLWTYLEVAKYGSAFGWYIIIYFLPIITIIVLSRILGAFLDKKESIKENQELSFNKD